MASLAIADGALLFAAGICAGGINSVAGGGGFITLPVLLLVGLPPIMANTTGSLAVWPGSLASLAAYRGELRAAGVPVRRYLALGAIGGVLGAVLLLVGSNRFFMGLLPYLLLLATVLLTWGPWLTSRLLHADLTRRPGWLVPVCLSAIALYGGYFGGGMGIMTLAVLAVMGMRDIHQMNAVKALLVATITGAGVAVFLITGLIAWLPCVVMMAGCIVGGYGVGSIARRLNRDRVRLGVTVFAWAMTTYFLVHAWTPP